MGLVLAKLKMSVNDLFVFFIECYFGEQYVVTNYFLTKIIPNYNFETFNEGIMNVQLKKINVYLFICYHSKEGLK